MQSRNLQASEDALGHEAVSTVAHRYCWIVLPNFDLYSSPVVMADTLFNQASVIRCLGASLWARTAQAVMGRSASLQSEATVEESGAGLLKANRYCDCAGTRSSKLVNPIAWKKGLVFAQCPGCKAWHKLRDEAGLVDEVKFTDED